MKFVQEVFTAQAWPGEAWGALPTVLPQSTELQHWVLPGACPCQLLTTPYPYTDKRFAWVRTKLEACEGCGHCHMLQWGCPAHGGCRRGLLGNMLHGRAEPLRDPGCRRHTKPSPAAQRGRHWDRCLQQMSVLRTYVAFSSTYYREQAGSSANK